MDVVETIQQKRERLKIRNEKISWLVQKFQLSDSAISNLKQNLANHFKKYGNYDIKRISIPLDGPDGPNQQPDQPPRSKKKREQDEKRDKMRKLKYDFLMQYYKDREGHQPKLSTNLV